MSDARQDVESARQSLICRAQVLLIRHPGPIPPVWQVCRFLAWWRLFRAWYHGPVVKAACALADYELAYRAYTGARIAQERAARKLLEVPK